MPAGVEGSHYTMTGSKVASGRKNRVYSAERFCPDETDDRLCGARLSRYNPGPGCSVHSYLNRAFRTRGRKEEAS